MNVRPPRPQADTDVGSSELAVKSECSSTEAGSTSMVDATSVPGCDQSGLSSAASSTATTPSATASAQDASDNVPTPSMSSLPPSLADLQNPATFSIQPSPKHGRKITKASFFDPSRPALGETAGDALEGSADPLSRLDPLWSLKPTGTSRDSAEEMEQS